MNDSSEYLDRILLDAYSIGSIIRSLAAQIKLDYKDRQDDLIVISVLKGAYFFTADLQRALSPELDPVVEFIQLSSYGAGSKSSGELKFKKELEDVNISGKDLLVVEDIVDTGLTISKLREYLLEKGAKSVRICVFLDKSEARMVEVKLDYVGSKIPSEFVVGYGLDYNEQYRNLPYIGVLKKEIYS
ncbi:MAG: hypoxanthine phosphoribosyltransferase [Patescibacteria group bacterium]|nr:hypoxanthine phosphoribosyltransferase [Patescibacteria group bacterium]MDD4304184.1 hypoxanthine phosphoribosyltransferase [Patescibacteria group bacterium]MDD4695216.1 hypoxanthine phosphoribosyltransferase [Patescibacteria group bacterium]